MNISERLRASGKCPPSLMRETLQEDVFEMAVSKVLDANGTCVVRLLILRFSKLSLLDEFNLTDSDIV